MRLGVYADLIYRRDDRGLSADRAFVNFVTALAPRLDELVLFGRLDPVPGAYPYRIPDEVRFAALPHYGSLRDALGVGRALRGAVRAFETELGRLDAVWLFGPHPLSLAFARAARRRGVRVFLGVRQDLPEYVARRVSGAAAVPARAAALALEHAYRRLARRAPAVVVGDELARRYRGSLAVGFSLARAADLVPVEAALAKVWRGRVLTVTRLDPEKNPLLLAEVVGRLGEGWTLEVVGDGPLREELERRAPPALTVAGYVPNGPELNGHYRAADAFLHVSLTEGLPQVLVEAQAAGLPVVATDVGGVRAAVGGSALLVRPQDPDAAAAALRRIPAERERLIRAGLENARGQTLEAQVERVLDFFAASSS